MARKRGSNRRLLTVLLAGALALLLTSTATATHVQDIAKSKKVNGNWKWVGGSPGKHFYVGNGHKMRWKVPATQGAWHDVTSTNQGKDWNYSVARLDPGESATRTFQDTGNYYFRCARHSAVIGGKCKGMCGIVHVV
jgi:plastocyanin